MASKTVQSYRMGTPHPETGMRPVNKLVRKIDGKADYVQMEKRIANTLEEFRDRYPTEPVEGAPRGDELRIMALDLTDEQLEELGLQKVGANTDSIFASEEAEIRFLESGLPESMLTPGAGNGANGKYNTADIKFLIAKGE